MTEQGVPTPLSSKGGGSGCHPTTVRVLKRSHSVGDTRLMALEEPILKAPRLDEDFEDLQGKIIGDATFQTAGGETITVIGGRGVAKYSGPARGGGVQMRGGNPGTSGCRGALQSCPHEGSGDPPLMDKTTRQGTRFALPSDSKKKRWRKSKDEEEDKPTSFTNPAHKEGGGDEPMPSDLMEVDDTSKQEEVEGKSPPNR